MSLAYPVVMAEVTADPHAAIKHAWYSSISGRNVSDLSGFELFEMGFRRGAQWSARVTGQLSPHLAALADFMVWLNERPNEQDDWDSFVEVPPTPYVGNTNGSGDENSPW